MYGDVGLLVAYVASPRQSTKNNARRHTAMFPVPARRSRAVADGLPWLVTQRFRANQVQLALRSDLSTTVRAGPVSNVEAAWEGWVAQCATAQPHCSLPAYLLLNTIVETYIPILDAIVMDVGQVERRLLDGNIDAGRALDPQDLFRCKRDLAQLGRVVGSQRTAITALWRLAHELVHADTPTYFQDVADHHVRLAQIVENYHDMLDSALYAYLVLVGNAENDIMKRLTSVTIVAGVSTLITASDGGNFHVSEFELVDGYPIAVGFTLVALGFNHGYLQWRGFI
jgi:Mg2+ and Co2+ transporter CorA